MLKIDRVRLAAFAGLCGVASLLATGVPAARAEDETPITPEHVVPINETNVELPIVVVNDNGIETRDVEAGVSSGGSPAGETVGRLPETHDRLPVIITPDQ